MKRSIVVSGVLAFLLAVLVNTPLLGQEQKKGAKMKPSQEEMMKRWQEAMTPGDAHKKLEDLVGSWDAEVKSWMNGPKGEPTISKATSEHKMALGGRFLQQDVTGEMMGQPFAGVGYTGYDKMKKKYVAVWMDNFGTMISTMEGTMDKEGTTLTTWGKMDEPMTGERDKKVKYVTRIIDKDKLIFEMYDLSTWGGKNPVMQITYTRK
jgi:hypothetical protein